MSDGVFGWRCACGFSTARPRVRIAQSAATACYPCRTLFDEGGTTCETCGSPLTRLDGEGLSVEAGDRAGATRYWEEQLFDQELCERYWTRRHPRPPFPTDASIALPGWSRQTDQTRAYDGWYRGMGEAWQTDKAVALADQDLVDQVRREIQPKVEERVALTMRGARRYRCPACDAFALEFFAVPYPS